MFPFLLQFIISSGERQASSFFGWRQPFKNTMDAFVLRPHFNSGIYLLSVGRSRPKSPRLGNAFWRAVLCHGRGRHSLPRDSPQQRTARRPSLHPETMCFHSFFNSSSLQENVTSHRFRKGRPRPFLNTVDLMVVCRVRPAVCRCAPRAYQISKTRQA